MAAKKSTKPLEPAQAAAKRVTARQAAAKAPPPPANPVNPDSVDDLPLDADEKGALQPMEQEGDLFADVAPMPRIYVQRPTRRKSNFKKPNALIHNKPQNVLTVTQQKILNILLFNTQQSTPVEENTWVLPISQLLYYLDVNTRNTDHIEKMIQDMSSIKVRWDALEEEGIAKYYRVVFPSAKFYAGEVRYTVDIQATTLLQEKVRFTNLNIFELARLSRACSVGLFEMASRYAGIGMSRWFDWPDFRDMILAADHIPVKAQTWMGFNERYLTPAVTDVNSTTPLFVKVETERYRGAVKRVRILVERQQKALAAPTLSSESLSELRMAMTGLGLLDKDITRIFAGYEEADIRAALLHTNWRLKNPGMSRLAAPGRFFKKSLEKGFFRDYAGSDDLFSAVTTPVASMKRSDEDSSDIGRKKLIEAVQKERLSRIKLILEEMNEAELERVYAEFNEGRLPANQISRKGRNRAGVLPSFQDWYIRKLWGEITDSEIVETMGRILGAQSK